METLLRTSCATPPERIDAILNQAADSGVAGIVWALDRDWPSAGDLVARWTERVSARHLRLDALFAPAVSLAAPQEGLRREAERVVEQLLAQAARLGARRLAAAIEPGTESARRDDVQARILEALSALRFEAESRGIEIICPCGGGTLLASPLETREFFDYVNSPWVRAGLNLTAMRSATDAVDWIGTLGRRVRWVIAPKETPEEALDWTTILGALRAARCEAMVVIDDIATATSLMPR